MAGYRDSIDKATREITRHNEYSKADRAYSTEYGSLEEYRDGYQQGFESGYLTGFERRSFQSTIPAGLKRRETAPAGELIAKRETPGETTAQEGEPDTELAGSDNGTAAETVAIQRDVTAQIASDAIIVIPSDTELIIELDEDLNTQQTREGQRFTAKVASPSEIAGATIEGRVTKVRQPGRIKRRSELLLSFDRIIINDQRWSNFSGTLIEVMPIKGDNIRKVDNEGTAIGKSSIKTDAVKVGGATGVGLVTGAVIGGPVGAAVGAGVGAAFGVGAVVIQRGKHIRLSRNQQIRIRTAYETRIR